MQCVAIYRLCVQRCATGRRRGGGGRHTFAIPRANARPQVDRTVAFARANATRSNLSLAHQCSGLVQSSNGQRYINAFIDGTVCEFACLRFCLIIQHAADRIMSRLPQSSTHEKQSHHLPSKSLPSNPLRQHRSSSQQMVFSHELILDPAETLARLVLVASDAEQQRLATMTKAKRP